MLLVTHRVPTEQQDLLGVRTDTPYTEAERRYSAEVEARLEELLQGKRRQLVLLRHDHRPPYPVAVMPAPAGVDRAGLRRRMVERILISTLGFIRAASPGGCVSQCLRNGILVETQPFATRYPHIVIERLDAYEPETRQPLFSEWRLRRVQNQRAETQINRWLDAANLALSVVKTLRNGGR